MKYIIVTLLLSVTILFNVNYGIASSNTQSDYSIYVECKELYKVPDRFKKIKAHESYVNLVFKPEFSSLLQTESVKRIMGTSVLTSEVPITGVEYPKDTPEVFYLTINGRNNFVLQSLKIVTQDSGVCNRCYYDDSNRLTFVEGGFAGTDKLFEIVVVWKPNNSIEKVVVINRFSNSRKVDIVEYK